MMLALQMTGLELRLSPNFSAWLQDNHEVLAQCSLDLQLERCLVLHETLPEAKIGLQLTDGLHANLSATQFDSIMKVVNGLTTKADTQAAGTCCHLTKHASDRVVAAGVAGPLSPFNTVEHDLSTIADEEVDLMPVMPHRSSLEIHIATGPITLALGGRDGSALLLCQVSGLECDAQVKPYVTSLVVRAGHMVVIDRFLKDHPPTEGDITVFEELLNTREQSFSCEVVLNDRTAAAAALKDIRNETAEQRKAREALMEDSEDSKEAEQRVALKVASCWLCSSLTGEVQAAHKAACLAMAEVADMIVCMDMRGIEVTCMYATAAHHCVHLYR